MFDRCSILDPPEFPTRYTSDDVPEQLGDDFTLSAEDDAKITWAAQRGSRAVKMALAGDTEAMAEMRRLHVTLCQVGRL